MVRSSDNHSGTTVQYSEGLVTAFFPFLVLSTPLFYLKGEQFCCFFYLHVRLFDRLVTKIWGRMNQQCIFSLLKDVQQFTVKQSLPHIAKLRLDITDFCYFIYLFNFCSGVMPAVSNSGTFPASHCGRSVGINNGVNNPLMHAVLNVFSRWGQFN